MFKLIWMCGWSAIKDLIVQGEEERLWDVCSIYNDTVVVSSCKAGL